MRMWLPLMFLMSCTTPRMLGRNSGPSEPTDGHLRHERANGRVAGTRWDDRTGKIRNEEERLSGLKRSHVRAKGAAGLTETDEMMYIISQGRTMRYSAEHKQQTRQRIVRAAARRFRSRGTEGATIGTLMRDLRLTHGGFYRHFGSKEQLFLEAFEQGLKELSSKALEAMRQAPRGAEVKVLIESYLDTEHASDVAGGCPVAALTAEIARRPAKARTDFLWVLLKHIGEVAKYIPGATNEERERKARVLFSGMAGTLNVARLIVDDQQRRRFLDDAKRFYLEAIRE